MTTSRLGKFLLCALVVAGFLLGVSARAQSGPSDGPTNIVLESWSFYDLTNWPDDDGFLPVSFTNITWSPLGADSSASTLVVDTNVPAWLQYNVWETNWTNLTVNCGTVTFWFAPSSWASVCDTNGGFGPGEYGRLLEVGDYTPNSSYGWWSIYVDNVGNDLYFSAQTNDLSSNVTTYVTAPIDWTTNYFHFIALTYCATSTVLYLDGVYATNGPGVTVYPGPNVMTNGFWIGSDHSGVYQAHGMFDLVATYDYPMNSNDVWLNYQNQVWAFRMNPNNVPMFSSASIQQPASFGTNLAISTFNISTNLASLFVVNTGPDILYEMQGCTNLSQGNWFSEGFLNGSEITNWTLANVSVNKQGNLFLRIRSWQDSTGSGIPDWWWLQYFGQDTNVNAYATDPAGDGFTDLQKFQMGLNPNIYYNPNGPPGFFGCIDASGTNAFLEWSNAPGPVINYSIQRGILNTNTGNYVYSQIGLVSSNATFFEDVGAVTNANSQNSTYHLEAVYPGNSLSATDTWTVWWYANYGNEGPPYGPPLPGNFYASADSTGTNVLLSWTPAQGATTNSIILHGIYNSTNSAYNYIQISNVSPGTTNFEIFGAITNDANWTDIYEVESVYPGGGLSTPASSYPGWPSSISINVGANTNGPAAPGNFYGYPDGTGTNIFLTWNPVSGAVTNYIIYGGIVDGTTSLTIYHRIGRVNSSTNFLEVVGAIDGGGNNLYSSYNVVAVYTNRSLSQSAAWSPSGGAPAPGALSAYVDSTGTNIVLAWTPATGAVTGYLLQVSDYYGDSWSYAELTNVSSTTFSFKDVDGVDNAYNGLDAVVYEVQATYPNGGLSPAITATVATNFPAPSNLAAAVDSTGTNVLLSWTAAVGAVSNYVILRGTYNASTGNYSYSTIGTVSSGTTSFQVAGAISGGNGNNDIYEVAATYPGGSLSSPVSSTITQSSTPPTYNLNVTAQMVRNQAGRWQLMFSSIPANVQKIAFYWYVEYYFGDGSTPDTGDFTSNGQPLTTENDIPVSSITNGVYVLPDFLMTNWFPNNDLGKVAWIQAVGTNNEYGALCQAGFQPYDSPVFVDARQHLKQNLLFKLRGATISQPIGLTEGNIWWDPLWISISIPADTNYVESSFFHRSWQAKTYADNFGGYYYMKMDNIWPFTANYELHGGLYDTNFSGPSFNWQPNASAAFPTSIAFQGTLATVPAAAVLGIADPYWISQGLGNPADVAAYTNSGNLYLQSGAHNLFGLAFSSALVNQYPTITLAPGSSTAMTNVGFFYSQTVDPNLLLTNYYFAPVNTPGTAMPGVYPAQLYPLPSDTGFANTNQTGIMIASVGTPTVIGGWARFSIVNGSSSKFAYLGQYFVTNAFVMTNGIVTANTTGIVSPYGDFFPTAPGAVAMITMPDINTGQQGTGVVRVVALNVDANHDGTMDFTYQGPDFVSSSKPFRFWVNDSQDAGDFGGTGIPGQGAQGNGVLKINGQWQAHGRRDLVNFFPVYINVSSLFQSNALSAGISGTDTNYQFILSQAEGVLRFAYTSLTPTNYMNFLQDTNVSGSLANATLTTITNGGVILPQSFVSGIATNNQGIILVEASAPATQPLVLSIYHGSNLLAQTSLPLSISGVEQMFRHKSLLINSDSREVPDRLTDASVPNEPDTLDENFVFVHGYNVNPQQARGWQADMFKRMYWSGSHAKFYGVTWEGYDTQGNIPGFSTTTPNYQTNVVRAFQTAPNLAAFISTLTNSGPVTVAAHSLGNMATLSALSDWNATISQYFMVDAAVPIEAIDGGTPINTNMVYSTSSAPWPNYATTLWASKWFNVWPTSDARSTLTWSNRLATFGGTTVYNFYSSGEEVLRTQTGAPPGNLLTLVGSQLMQWIQGQLGTYAWAWQEKLKGCMSGNSILSSDHGGWGLNENLSSGYVFFMNGLRTNIPPAVITNSVLQTNAFFDMSVDTAMFTTSSSGSTYAQTNRNRILSDAIPAVTLPIGANPVSRLAPQNGNNQNFDMQSLYENGWPIGRGPASWPTGTAAFGEWHHSDVRVVAYTFTYQLFNQMVTVGNLK